MNIEFIDIKHKERFEYIQNRMGFGYGDRRSISYAYLIASNLLFDLQNIYTDDFLVGLKDSDLKKYIKSKLSNSQGVLLCFALSLYKDMPIFRDCDSVTKVFRAFDKQNIQLVQNAIKIKYL